LRRLSHINLAHLSLTNAVHVSHLKIVLVGLAHDRHFHISLGHHRVKGLLHVRIIHGLKMRHHALSLCHMIASIEIHVLSIRRIRVLVSIVVAHVID
jgi:hypothetical protein